MSWSYLHEKIENINLFSGIKTKLIISLSLMITFLRPDYIMTKNTQKKIVYNTSLGYNLLKHYYLGSNWWDHIEDNIVLGAIPLKNYNHNSMLALEGINVVISLVEDHEYDQTYFSDPVLGSDWNDLGITYVSYPTPDFNAIDPVLLDTVIQFMFDCIMKKQKIYIHCKAGKGRSAIAVICFLLKYHLLNGSPQDAIEYVRSKRSVISMNEQQLQSIDGFYATLSAKNAPLCIDSDNDSDDCTDCNDSFIN